ncbi:AraC family transcriptional regulator [Paenibacillus assamensis]|uniref:AraC family transcriptional regulator n=1 Tax=Paenibacillus assamensis TaxID=311244 RepID=UPI0004203F7B|nr:AraC family transcriptional regulator [Paenibacillus assamensis]
MEALLMLRQAIDYIEDHLSDKMEIDEIAKAALLSKYHFQRMFHALTGFTLTEYIRNRRLTIAAEEIAGTSSKVIDIALKYGYESPEAFTKAFQRLHGVTPSQAKKTDVKLKTFPKLSFQIQIQGVMEMNYRIVEEQAMIVAGTSKRIMQDPYQEIPMFVEAVWNNGTHDRINEVLGNSLQTLLDGYHFDLDEESRRSYLVGGVVPEGIQVPTDFSVLNISAQTYAVFDRIDKLTEDNQSRTGIKEVWRRIYSEWFPSVSFEQVEGPCIEKYEWIDDQKVDYKCEVWIPVKRKAS